MLKIKDYVELLKAYYSNKALITSVEVTEIDKMSDNGYKTDKMGFSFGTSYEQYENLYFSPNIKASIENLETTSTASNSLKKQEGNYSDLYFQYGLNYVFLIRLDSC